MSDWNPEEFPLVESLGAKCGTFAFLDLTGHEEMEKCLRELISEPIAALQSELEVVKLQRDLMIDRIQELQTECDSRAGASMEERWKAIHDHDCPIFSDFFDKWAIGSKLPASCFVCGQSMAAGREVGVSHAELPGIVVCLECRDVRLQRDAAIAREEALKAQNEVMGKALTRLRDCDWVITPADRMDAVRDIAREALEACGTVSDDFEALKLRAAGMEAAINGLCDWGDGCVKNTVFYNEVYVPACASIGREAK